MHNLTKFVGFCILKVNPFLCIVAFPNEAEIEMTSSPSFCPTMPCNNKAHSLFASRELGIFSWMAGSGFCNLCMPQFTNCFVLESV